MKHYTIDTGPSENAEKNSIDLKWAKISGASQGDLHQWGEENQAFGSLEVQCGPNLAVSHLQLIEPWVCRDGLVNTSHPAPVVTLEGL